MNFDTIPQDNPNITAVNIPPEGKYIGTILKATPQKPYDAETVEELHITFSLVDANTGADAGVFVDKLKDTPSKPASQYKIGRFVLAQNLQLKGNVPLKDIAKLVVGNKLVFMIKHFTASEGANAGRTYAFVDPVSNDMPEIYAPYEDGPYNIPNTDEAADY